MNNRRNIFTLPLLFPSLAREAPRIHWRDAVIGLDCATFSPAHSGRAKTRPYPCEGLPLLPLVLYPHAREWPDYPFLRALNEHCLTVRVLRARRIVWPLPPFPSSFPSLKGSGNSNEGMVGLSSTARVQRGPSQAARCASKEDGPTVPCVPSSTDSLQYLPIRLFNLPQILPKPILI